LCASSVLFFICVFLFPAEGLPVLLDLGLESKFYYYYFFINLARKTQRSRICRLNSGNGKDGSNTRFVLSFSIQTQHCHVLKKKKMTRIKSFYSQTQSILVAGEAQARHIIELKSVPNYK